MAPSSSQRQLAIDRWRRNEVRGSPTTNLMATVTACAGGVHNVVSIAAAGPSRPEGRRAGFSRGSVESGCQRNCAREGTIAQYTLW
jgi:hypothetical protein